MKYDYTHLATPLGKAPGGFMNLISALFSANSTYNYKGGYPLGNSGGIVNTPGAFNVAEIKLDFAAIALARAAAGQAAFAATDVLELFVIPAGTWVLGCFAETLTVEGEAATVGMGDGTTPSGFISAFDANALGFGSSIITTTYSLATAGGKIYSVADTIDIVLNTAAFNVAKMRFMAALVDLRAQR